jgi:hypothetical protein
MGTPTALPIQDFIRQAAKRHGVPESLALAVAEKESSFNPEAVGPDIPSMPGVKALGTFQLLPSTAKQLGVDPSDPAANIEGGVKYLRQLLDASNGDLDLTLKTYGGFKTVDPTNYITDINERMAKFGSGASVSAVAPPPPTAPVAPPVASGRAGGPGPAATQPPGMDPNDTGFMDPVKIGKALVEPYDPRKPEGRQNLAGLAGEVALSKVPGATALKPFAQSALRVVAPAVGAGLFAGAEAAIEQAVAPRGLGDLVTGEAPDSPTRVAAEQALYSIGGQAVMWPLRRAGKLFLGGQIGKAAEAGVKAEVKATREAGTRATTQIRDKVAEGVEAARILERANTDAVAANLQGKIAQARAAATAAVGSAELQGAERVAAAKTAAASKLAQQELDNTALVQTITKGYDDLLATPPSVAAAVGATRNVLEGPAKRALEMAGQRVDEAAASGPMINVGPIKKALEGFIKQKRPDVIFQQGKPKLPQIGFGPRAVEAAKATAGGTKSTMTGSVSPEEMTNLQKAIAQALGVPESHPLPGVVGKILTIGPEQIPFKEAHQIKRLLDEAVNWDRVAKKHLEAITKATRGELRTALAVHEPYNVATAAYHSLVPIYRKGIGKRLSSALMNNPDQAARLLKDNDPIQAATLKDLLVTQSAAGGDARAGQIAWDMVRSHWTYDRLIRGGADGLADRVRGVITEHPEFVKVIADDDAGKQVLQNLATLGDAITAAKTLGAERLAATKTAGKEAVAATGAQADALVTATRARGRRRRACGGDQDRRAYAGQVRCRACAGSDTGRGRQARETRAVVDHAQLGQWPGRRHHARGDARHGIVVRQSVHPAVDQRSQRRRSHRVGGLLAGEHAAAHRGTHGPSPRSCRRCAAPRRRRRADA